jgi:heparosan-N-sulfate-glucuronate 5-epimerase
MKQFVRRIAGHVIDLTDRLEIQTESTLWQPGSLDDYFIDLRLKLALLPENEHERLSRLRQALPVALCQFALAHHQQYRRTRAPEALNGFLACADLLVAGQQQEGVHRGAWLYDVPSPYRSPRPWASAMAQGQALSVLSRAHLANGQGNRYAEAARLGFTLFGRTIDAGGVISRDDAGLVCLEEYPSDPPGHVLNGWIFALVGLREYADTFGDGQAADLAAESLHALARMLPRYDTGFWSRYDLFAQFPMAFLANRFYHRLHIAQLRAMFRLSGRPIFQEFADRWLGYLASRTCRLRYNWHRVWYKGACLVTGW